MTDTLPLRDHDEQLAYAAWLDREPLDIEPAKEDESMARDADEACREEGH